MTKRALITGITGMDGSHMADLLLSKNYEVFGMERHKSSGDNHHNIDHILDKITIIKGDLADSASLHRVLEMTDPDEVYNFASQSFVGSSWEIAEYTANITGMGVLRLLDVVRNYNKNIRFLQASSSEMFGLQEELRANENTRFNPRSPYAIAKVFAHQMVKNYRDAYGMFACSSICFNHESERRGHQFVTRKISDGVAKIALGMKQNLTLGRLSPERDWGYAPDYMVGIWTMLQEDEPEDFVFATGESHSVEDFVVEAFRLVNIDDWERFVIQDARFTRKVEVNHLRGDYNKAFDRFGWEPKVKFQELVARMVKNDLQLLQRQIAKDD